MNELEQLEKTIAALEAHRSILGEDVVDTALAPIRQRLAALEAGEQQRRPAAQPAPFAGKPADPEAGARGSDWSDQEEPGPETEPSGLLADDLAGLARGELDRGDLIRAHSYVEEILSSLASHPKARMNEPARVYLTCVRVLEAAGDPRARAVVEVAYAWLQERAARIQGEEARASFLRNVPANQEIVAEWEKRTYEE